MVRLPELCGPRPRDSEHAGGDARGVPQHEDGVAAVVVVPPGGRGAARVQDRVGEGEHHPADLREQVARVRGARLNPSARVQIDQYATELFKLMLAGDAACEVFLRAGAGVKDTAPILLATELLDQFSLGHTWDGAAGAIGF